MTTTLKIAIAGASSLAGKELSDTFADSPLAAARFILLDDEEAQGQLENVGDEVTFIQKIGPDSFEGADFVFFAGKPETAHDNVKAAQLAGASIVDMTYALETIPGTVVCAPWVAELLKEAADPAARPAIDLRTPAVIAAHPAAVLLATVLGSIHAQSPIRSASATVLEPASQYGRPAMDELHQQTIALLSFQTLPKETYDAQVAFNLLPTLGEEAKVDLLLTEQRIRRHLATITNGALPAPAIQLAHSATFHGYIASILVELDEPMTEEALAAALEGDHVDVVLGESDPPSNLSAAGQEDILVRLRPEPPTAPGSAAASRKFWLWVAADNLKLAALNAIACASELRRLRPQGQVQ